MKIVSKNILVTEAEMVGRRWKTTAEKSRYILLNVSNQVSELLYPRRCSRSRFYLLGIIVVQIDIFIAREETVARSWKVS